MLMFNLMAHSYFYANMLTLIQKNQMPMLRMPAMDVSTKYMVMTVIKI